MSTRRSSGAAATAAASAAAAAPASPARATRATRRGSSAQPMDTDEQQQQEEQHGERKSTTAATSPAKHKRGAKASAASAAAEDSFAFDLDEPQQSAAEAEAEAEEMDTAAEEKGSSSSSRQKRGAAAAAKKGAAAAAAATASSPSKSASPASLKKRGGGRRASDAAADYSLDLGGGGEEHKSSSSMLDSHASAAENDAFDRASLSGGAQASSSIARSKSSMAAGPTTKEESDKLMDAELLKQAMGASKDELLKRLKKLSLCLLNLPPRSEVSAKIRALAGALIDRHIVLNKSSEVRAVAACCTADLFRMCAPTSPFTDDQLKVVFDLYLGLLANLAQPTHPDFGRYYYLLESLVKTRFATQLANKDPLEMTLVKLFAIFFKLAPHDLSHHIMGSFVTIMGDVCDRLDPFPPALLDEILRQLTTEVTSSNPKCSELALQLLSQDKYRDVFERPVVMFLKDTLVDKLEGDDLSTTITEHEDHLSVLAKLSEFCVDLMTGFQRYALHLLESSDEHEREEYTDLFSQVFISHAFSSHPQQVVKFEPLFEVLMKRFVDVSPKIRAQVARQAGDMLVAHEPILEHCKTILGYLLEALLDREESVRQAAIDSIKSAGLANGELLSTDIIEAVGARCADKKHSVRLSALNCMAELFSHHCACHWRVGTGTPVKLGIYRTIPKKLVQASKLNRHTSVMVDVLLDEKLLGADVSVEERTRCLLGIYMALVSAKKAPKPAAPAEDEEAHNAAARAQAKEEADPLAARHTFRDILLGGKMLLHRHINHLLSLASNRSARSDDDQSKFDNDKHASLMVLGKQLHFEGDSTPEDIAQALHAMIFEAKDKNIAKYLRALSNPVTQYEQIRLAQSGLVQAVKQMPQYATFKNKKGAASLGTLSSRLSTMLSLAILPMEAVEMIYAEMANFAAKRSAVFTACQEMLILIGQTFPALLSHPHTGEALLQHLQLGVEKQNDGMIRNTLQILTAIKDLKTFHADKKQANEFLAQLKELAFNGSEAHAALAVECIQHLWGQPHGVTQLMAIQSAGTEVTAEPDDATDPILSELLSAHCDQNLSLSSERLPAALSCCAKIIELNFPLFMKRTEDRSTLLMFLMHELMPAEDIAALREARAAGILLVQQYLSNFALSHRSLDMVVGSPVASAGSAGSSPKKRASGVLKEDSAIQPRNWLIILLKILKLDGRFPDLTGTTKDMLARLAGQEEDEEHEQARHEFLINAAYALLELCTVPLYHKFFFHAPSHAAPVAAAGAGGPLSPSAGVAASSAPKERHQFQFLSLAYLARHSHGNIAHQFVERVMTLMARSPATLPFPPWAAVVVLGATQEDKAGKARIEHFLEFQIRRRRTLAVAAQHRYEAQEAAASAPVEAKGSKKKKGRKSKGADEEAEDMDVDAADRRTARVANGLFPEYALLDLIYVLSYDPDFQDRLPVAPTDQDRDRVFEVYDRMLGYIDFFLNCIMHDPPEQGGGHFSLVFSMLARLRSMVDARNPDNSKIQKLGELALLSLQERSALQKWSDQKWESRSALSSNLFRPRAASESAGAKDKYLPQAYQPRVRIHVHGKDKGAEGTEGTPKRKRKSGAGAAEGGEGTPKSATKRRTKKITHEGSEGEDDESDAAGGGSASTPAKKARVSASPAKKKAAKIKEESTPTRTTHARGAKAKEIKYEEGEDEEEEEEEEATTTPTKQRGRAKAAAVAASVSEDEEEEEGSAAEAEDEEDDIDMTKPKPAPRGGKKAAASRKKAASPVAMSDDDEEQEPQSEEEEEEEEDVAPSKRGGVKQKAATSPASKKPSASSSSKKKGQKAADSKQPGIKGFLNGQ